MEQFKQALLNKQSDEFQEIIHDIQALELRIKKLNSQLPYNQPHQVELDTYHQIQQQKHQQLVSNLQEIKSEKQKVINATRALIPIYQSIDYFIFTIVDCGIDAVQLVILMNLPQRGSLLAIETLEGQQIQNETLHFRNDTAKLLSLTLPYLIIVDSLPHNDIIKVYTITDGMLENSFELIVDPGQQIQQVWFCLQTKTIYYLVKNIVHIYSLHKQKEIAKFATQINDCVQLSKQQKKTKYIQIILVPDSVDHPQWLCIVGKNKQIECINLQSNSLKKSKLKYLDIGSHYNFVYRDPSWYWNGSVEFDQISCIYQANLDKNGFINYSN